MKPLTATEVERLLKANGFMCVGSRGSHFKWVNAVTGRSVPVPHHGNRKLQQGLLLGIFRQAGIPHP